jgi:Putative beta-barrel porin 2
MKSLLTTLTLTLAAASPALAQEEAPRPPAGAEMHLGPVTLRPRLDIREIGFDSNVFNEATDPKEDFTANFTPRLDVLAEPAWARIRYATYANFVYFQDFSDERSINVGNEGRFDLILNRFRPYVAGVVANTRDRLNAEIDARAERRDWRLEGGTLVALTSRTSIVAAVRHGSLEFDEDEVFNGVPLAATMNSDFDAFESGLRFALTPLTTLQVTGLYQRDRFDTASGRDSTTWRIVPTLEFAPDALISGRLTVGFTSFEPKNSSIEAYRGLTTSGSLVWSMDTTKLEGRIERDVHYSYELLQPYYLTTGGQITLTQIIAGPLDVQLSAGRQRLEYRDNEAALDLSIGERADTLVIWSAGLGYRLGDTARIGINYEDASRDSPVLLRTFDRHRIYGSLSYGF